MAGDRCAAWNRRRMARNLGRKKRTGICRGRWERKRDELGSERGGALMGSKEGHAFKGNFMCKDVALGKKTSFIQKGWAHWQLYYLIDTF